MIFCQGAFRIERQATDKLLKLRLWLGRMDHQKSLHIYNLEIIVMRCDVMYWKIT